MSKRVVKSISQLIKQTPTNAIELLVGKKFGRLLIKKYEGCYNGAKQGRHYYTCICDCGKELLADYGHLKNGDWTSCGCYKVDHPSRFKHGFAPLKGKRDKIYHAWKGMHSRCSEKYKNDSTRKYGEKGIKVCYGWSGEDGFINFKNDMTPITDKSIDRINNDLHYSCGHCNECVSNRWELNCRWGNDFIQSNNRSGFNNIIEIDGKKMTYREGSRYLGLPEKTLQSRIKTLGWSIEKSIKTPITNNSTRKLYQ